MNKCHASRVTGQLLLSDKQQLGMDEVLRKHTWVCNAEDKDSHKKSDDSQLNKENDEVKL